MEDLFFDFGGGIGPGAMPMVMRRGLAWFLTYGRLRALLDAGVTFRCAYFGTDAESQVTAEWGDMKTQVKDSGDLESLYEIVVLQP